MGSVNLALDAVHSVAAPQGLGDRVAKPNVEENVESAPDPWQDPDLPVGLAPATLPRWPLYLAAAAWIIVIAFLGLMAIGRP